MSISKNSNRIEQYHLNKNQPEKIQFELYPLDEYLKDSDGCAHEPHIHSFYQIIWFTKGEGKHFVDFGEYDFTENTIFFIPKGQIHYFDDSLCNGYVIHFNEIFLSEDQSDINVFLKYNIFNSFDSEPLFRIDEDKIHDLQLIIDQIQNEIDFSYQFAHKDYLKHLLNLFLISIQRLGKRNNSKNLSINNSHHITYIKFRQLLESNYKEIHTVNEYASLMNISAKTLTNYTKEISYRTPLEIINERLTLEAKRLLSHSGLNVNEIAFQLGFTDPSYFVKFFKKREAMSPSDFRKVIS